MSEDDKNAVTEFLKLLGGVLVILGIVTYIVKAEIDYRIWMKGLEDDE